MLCLALPPLLSSHLQAETEIEEFLKGEPDFLQCEKMLRRHQETLSELQFDIQENQKLNQV